MNLKDFHVHSKYSDGANTLEEMVQAAIKRGMKQIGFSDHSYTFYDESYCMKKENIEAYKKDVRALKEKYKFQIEVFCGIEQEYYSAESTKDYDYAIGSCHYIKVNDHGKDIYTNVDEDAQTLVNLADKYFGGDIYAVIEQYFRNVADVVNKVHPQIIGHFNLICKYNQVDPFFDEHHPRYVAAWQKAADELIKTGVPFEINFGAVSRGYRDEPYPSKEMREYIRSRGGKFILSSDSHMTETLCYNFEKFEDEIR